MGNDLYKYIKELEGKSYQNNVIFSGDIQGTYHEILHCSFALAFWYISALKHPIKNDTCCRYFLRDSHKYDKIVVAAKKFDELRAMIR